MNKHKYNNYLFFHYHYIISLNLLFGLYKHKKGRTIKFCLFAFLNFSSYNVLITLFNYKWNGTNCTITIFFITSANRDIKVVSAFCHIRH